MFPDKRAMCDNLVYIAEDLFLFKKTKTKNETIFLKLSILFPNLSSITNEK